MLQYIQAHVPPGEKIFVYPSQPLFYYLTGTVNPTAHDFLQIGLFSPDQFQGVIHQLELDQTKVVLMDPFTSDRFLFFFPATPPSVLAAPDPVADYIQSHYRACVRETDSRNPWRYFYMVRKDLACPGASALNSEQ